MGLVLEIVHKKASMDIKLKNRHQDNLYSTIYTFKMWIGMVHSRANSLIARKLLDTQRAMLLQAGLAQIKTKLKIKNSLGQFFKQACDTMKLSHCLKKVFGQLRLICQSWKQSIEAKTNFCYAIG